MGKKRKIGKKFSYTTREHIRRKETDKTVTTDLVLSREEARRLIAAVNNTLICDSDAEGIRIVCYDKWNPERCHCIVYPR